MTIQKGKQMQRIFYFIALVWLTGCANTVQTASGFMNNIGDALNSKIQKSSADSNVSHLRDTPLKGVLSGNMGEWPRVALTINSLPKWFYDDLLKKGQYGSNDCIVVSFAIWESATKFKSFDNIKFCGDDIVKETPYGDLYIWSNFGSAQKTQNSGTKRTAGPLPPERLFPNKTGLTAFFPMHGSFYLGGIMETLGYNWKESGDYRFWVVDLPTQAQSMRGETIATPTVNITQSLNSSNTGQVAKSCTPSNFTQQKFDQIARGMTIDQVNQLLGCSFDPYYNQNSGKNKMRMWVAESKGLVAAYAIRVNFDKNNRVFGPDGVFKTADGF